MGYNSRMQLRNRVVIGAYFGFFAVLAQLIRYAIDSPEVFTQLPPLADVPEIAGWLILIFGSGTLLGAGIGLAIRACSDTSIRCRFFGVQRHPE